MEKLNLPSYMGDWYVIANIPTFYEVNAYNSVEGYRLLPDGTIHNYFESNRGSFTGPRKRITAKAWVVNHETNKSWRVQFFWPLSFAYEVVEFDPEYRYTVVAHPSQRYVWIMAREPRMNEGLLNEIISRLKAQGFKTDKIKKVPQSDRKAKKMKRKRAA